MTRGNPLGNALPQGNGHKSVRKEYAMFTLRRMFGRISVGCPDGSRLHFMNLGAALEFIKLVTEGNIYG